MPGTFRGQRVRTVALEFDTKLSLIVSSCAKGTEASLPAPNEHVTSAFVL